MYQPSSPSEKGVFEGDDKAFTAKKVDGLLEEEQENEAMHVENEPSSTKPKKKMKNVAADNYAAQDFEEENPIEDCEPIRPEGKKKSLNPLTWLRARTWGPNQGRARRRWTRSRTCQFTMTWPRTLRIPRQEEEEERAGCSGR